MDPVIKARWTNKLREPNRKQARGHLLDEDGGQCCLGVLCEVAVEDGIIAKPEVAFDDKLGYRAVSGVGTYLETALLPTEVWTWAGLDRANPVMTYHGNDAAAAELNDSYGLSFAEIADVIDEQL